MILSYGPSIVSEIRIFLESFSTYNNPTKRGEGCFGSFLDENPELLEMLSMTLGSLLSH